MGNGRQLFPFAIYPIIPPSSGIKKGANRPQVWPPAAMESARRPRVAPTSSLRVLIQAFGILAQRLLDQFLPPLHGPQFLHSLFLFIRTAARTFKATVLSPRLLLPPEPSGSLWAWMDLSGGSLGTNLDVAACSVRP